MSWHPYKSNCNILMTLSLSLSLSLICKEANQCADALTKFGATLSSNYINFVNPPLVMEDLLAFNKAELYCNRLIRI